MLEMFCKCWNVLRLLLNEERRNLIYVIVFEYETGDLVGFDDSNIQNQPVFKHSQFLMTVYYI